METDHCVLVGVTNFSHLWHLPAPPQGSRISHGAGVVYSLASAKYPGDTPG